jgi:Mg2+-importing ATPase
VLLNNFVYDVGQTAVATDRVDPAFLEHPRRWDIGAIGRTMVVLGPLSSLFDYLTFGALWWLFDAGSRPALFQTGWFVESLLSQTLVVHVLRTAGLPFVDSRPSTPLLLATGAICATAVALPYSPLAGPLGMVPLPAAFWPVVAAIVGAYLLSAQVAKRALVRHARLA